MTFRGKDIHKLEKGWDNHVSINPSSVRSDKQQYGFANDFVYSQPEGFEAKGFEKPFAFEDHSSNPYAEAEIPKNAAQNVSKNAVQNVPNGSKPFSAFASISATLGFIHHEGTDQDRELEIIKCILLRENIIMKLENICEKISHCDILVQNSSLLEKELLETLSQMRAATTTFIEYICMWRETATDYEPHNLRTFIWEGQNYILKVTRDLDFLADQPLLVASLQFPPEKMRRNPLMLPNNLEEADTWINPRERASFDSGGVTDGSFFDERLRVRKAERVLLQELELSLNEDIVPEWDVEYNNEISHNSNSNNNNSSNNSNNSNSSNNNKSKSGTNYEKPKYDQIFSTPNGQESDILTWKYDAHMQLKNLEKSRGEKLSSSSTNRIVVHTPVSVPNSPKTAHTDMWLAEPTKLSSFLSSYSTAVAVQSNTR